jgi:hypothetical protein
LRKIKQSGITPAIILRTPVEAIKKGRQFYHPYFSKEFGHRFYKLGDTIFQLNDEDEITGYMKAGKKPEEVFGLWPMGKKKHETN